MNDSDVLKYLLSHTPLDRFYLFTPRGTDDTLMKYFDSTGVSWNLMEDDDETVALAVAFLKKSGAKSFRTMGRCWSTSRAKALAGIVE